MSVNPYKIVEMFESAVAEYAGSKYAVAVESCTAALFLSMMWVDVKGDTISIPKRTYVSVPCQIIHAGANVHFEDIEWEGLYALEPFPIIDGALRFKRGMYIKDTYHCLSFHIKKLIPIGRGGAILTDNKSAYEWFKKARFDGRNPIPLQEDNFDMLGWNLYMNPPDAARGLQLLQALGDTVLEDLKVEEQGYPNLDLFEVYKR